MLDRTELELLAKWLANADQGCINCDVLLACVDPSPSALSVPYGYTTSLAVAIAFLERVFPAITWTVSNVNGGYAVLDFYEDTIDAGGKTPTLALCLAIVLALLSEEDEHETPS